MPHNPRPSAKELETAAYTREYRRLIQEGFTDEEAQQWLETQAKHPPNRSRMGRGDSQQDIK